MSESSHYLDRISQSTSSLLVLSNGHGEDVIALRVLQALHLIRPDISIEVLPLVGEGLVFNSAIEEGWINKSGPLIRLPSGGFSNQSLAGLISDIFAGLIRLTFQQWKYVRYSARKGSLILAIGDLFPLMLAWVSGTDFAFIGTPKSDYTWKSGPGFAISDIYHSIKGTEWDPWEIYLMRSSRNRIVAVRDSLTARGLRRKGVNAIFPGNPMMDGFCELPMPEELQKYRRVLLLCGSRMPEAQRNLKSFLEAFRSLDTSHRIVFLLALTSEPTLLEVENLLRSFSYAECDFSVRGLEAASCWRKGQNFLFLGQGKFSSWANWVEMGIANAGTASEQLVGLGVPVLSLPSNGPQFTRSFAMRQSRLLGGSVIPCKSKEILIDKLNLFLCDSDVRSCFAQIGAKRMGNPGGSAALASLLSKQLMIK